MTEQDGRISSNRDQASKHWHQADHQHHDRAPVIVTPHANP
jgi:hypothetical protein